MTAGLTRLSETVTRYPRVIALFAGLIAAGGFVPLSLWPLTILGIALLIWLVTKSESLRQAFLYGWLFGWSHFTLTNNWIATAFTYQAEMPAWLGWLAVPLLALYLAIYPGLAALGAHLVVRRRNSLAITGLALAACWIVAEWLRSWVFTGYAWGPLGLAFLGPFDRPGIAAVLPWIGTYALSGLIVLAATAVLVLGIARKWIALAGTTITLVAAMYFPGGAREEGTVAFTLVQPDIRQEELDDPSKFEEQFARVARLTAPTELGAQRIVLWPESGVPDYLEDGYPQRYYDQMTAGGDPRFARWRIGRVVGEGGLLLTGSTHLNIGEVDGIQRATGARNSVTVLSPQGEIVGGYAKSHLVPYGEYLALRWLLEPLGATRLVAGSIDFIPGPGPETLDLGAWGLAGIQICYEIIFSGQVTDGEKRPDYIFNPSNDGWFGAWGPPQHLAQARMRAIEEGLPVLRSTTTGISAVIDADGVVRQHIPMHQADRIDGFVPPPKAATLFSRLGNILPLAWALLLVIGSLVAMRRSAR
ncbi:apolipoprotein N-acyltransferase [Altererythrobacter sp. MF3-039]|uniref:apolipoprotein N-acyltransferase n=1 Tax=Altererythrobacter sp. MF3-039 TaxID=3252901 RepID=UPI00390CCF9B